MNTEKAWFIVSERSDRPVLYTFTATYRRKDAWAILERLYEGGNHHAAEVARIRRERKSGKLRAVRATITWENVR